MNTAFPDQSAPAKTICRWSRLGARGHVLQPARGNGPEPGDAWNAAFIAALGSWTEEIEHPQESIANKMDPAIDDPAEASMPPLRA